MRYVAVVRVLAIQDAQNATTDRYNNILTDALPASEREMVKVSFSADDATGCLDRTIRALAALSSSESLE